MASRLGAGKAGGSGDGEGDDQSLLVLYGSDGGNASAVAKRVTSEAKKRGLKAECKAADECDPRRLTATPRVAVIVSTAGQGDVPANCREFWKGLQSTDMPQLDDSVKFTVFGLGDSHYWPREDQKHLYNKASKDVYARLAQLGADPLTPIGLGDDQDDDGFEDGYHQWAPSLWESLGVGKASDREQGGEGDAAPAAAHRPDDDIKEDSNHLRGTLASSLLDESTGAIPFEDTKISKFHGIYMQHDRDIAPARMRAGLEPAYSFMIRVRLPGGISTPAQWVVMDELAQTRGNGTLKLTTRQAYQLHGVVKKELKATVRAFNAALMDSLAACGDVNRNAMLGSSAPDDGVYHEVLRCVQSVSDHLTPRSGAYHEVWLDKKQVGGGAPLEEEPIYGKTYLPRKFKIAFAIPPNNDVDVLAHDLGLVAVTERVPEGEEGERGVLEVVKDDAAKTGLDAKGAASGAGSSSSSSSAVIEGKSDDGKEEEEQDAEGKEGLGEEAGVEYARPPTHRERLVGFTVTVGGGMGATHGNKATFPRLAEALCFCRPEEVNELAEAIVTVQRDFGDRVNRKHARMKYTIDDRGLAWFRGEVERRLGRRLQAPRAVEFDSTTDQYGWRAGTDGLYHALLWVQNGRVRDDPGHAMRSALRKLAEVHDGDFRLTANQNVVVGSVQPQNALAVQRLLEAHGMRLAGVQLPPEIVELGLRAAREQPSHALLRWALRDEAPAVAGALDGGAINPDFALDPDGAQRFGS